MTLQVYRTSVQVGWQKGGALGNKGERVSAFIGTPTDPDSWLEIKCGEGQGVDLHARTKKPYRWWLADVWLAEGDLLKINTMVGTLGVGPDEDRTVELLYQVDPAVGVVEMAWPGIGYKDYPLIRGCLREITRTSAAKSRIIHKITPVLDGAGETRTIESSDPEST